MTSGNGASANGSSPNGGGPSVSPSGLASLVSNAVSAIAREAQERVPKADLDERDPDYIREQLPSLWLFASLYFRADVRGLKNIPAEGRCCWWATTRAAT